MATTPHRPFPDQYLLEYADEHVCYEVEHFFWLVNVFNRPTLICAASTSDAIRVRNLLIEGFGLHFRNVVDFLYPRSGVRPDDIVAADFLPAGSWEAIKPQLSTSLLDARNRADKEMAHLTTARKSGNPPEKNWETTALANELRPILRLMCDNAVSTRLTPKLMQLIR
jgi:hypothetical protein